MAYTVFAKPQILARLTQQNLNLTEHLPDANLNRKGRAEGLMTEWKREGVKAVKETHGWAMKIVPILSATDTWKASPTAHSYTRQCRP